MIHYEKWEKVKGALFFLGFCTSQLRHIPLALLALASTTALSFYFVGYLLWLFTCHQYPDHPHIPQKWYGFAQFKDQHKAAAILGMLAIACSFFAIFIPILIIPSYWLLTVSSCIWSISEYHKLKNPLACEKNYSHSRQSALFRYATLIALITAIFAIATTIPIFFPAIATGVFVVATILEVTLGVTAFYYWISCNFGKHEANEKNNQPSYEKIAQNLPKIGLDEQNSESLEPSQQTVPHLASANSQVINSSKFEQNISSNNLQSSLIYRKKNEEVSSDVRCVC